MRFSLLILFLFVSLVAQSQELTGKMHLYLIPGQGADERSFKNLHFDSSKYVLHYINYVIPAPGEKLPNYAKRLAEQIEATQNFSLIGVSFGGMIVTEMCDFLEPDYAVVISSAKTRKELPTRYRFQRYIPLYRVVPPWVIKKASFIAQPLVEPDRNKEKAICIAMLEDKDPQFLKRSIAMIMRWDRKMYDEKIVHIHGDDDHTLPIKNIKCDLRVQNGSHMMVLTKAPTVQHYIKLILEDRQ